MGSITLNKRLARKVTHLYRAVNGQSKPNEAVPLSLANAKAVYGNRLDVTIHHFYRESNAPLHKPKHLPEDATFAGYKSPFPDKASSYDAVLLDIRNDAFTFQYNHLLDDNKRPIYESTVKPYELPIKYEYLLDPPNIAGTVAYLANTVPNQYGHWIQTQLPLLLAYWETFGKQNIDYYYVGDYNYLTLSQAHVADFVEESLGKLGIRREQILNRPCRATRSLIAMKHREIDKANLRTGFEVDAFSHRFMKENLFQPQPGLHAKKIFVKRGNVSARRELNLAELQAALESQGFVSMSMEGKTMQQEADIFGNADVIVSVHGSALHNALFCRPGTKVIEIFPYDYCEASNYVICNHSGCDYHYLIGEPLPNTLESDDYYTRMGADVIVNTDKLLRLCRQVGVDSAVTTESEAVH